MTEQVHCNCADGDDTDNNHNRENDKSSGNIIWQQRISYVGGWCAEEIKSVCSNRTVTQICKFSKTGATKHS